MFTPDQGLCCLKQETSFGAFFQDQLHEVCPWVMGTGWRHPNLALFLFRPRKKHFHYNEITRIMFFSANSKKASSVAAQKKVNRNKSSI